MDCPTVAEVAETSGKTNWATVKSTKVKILMDWFVRVRQLDQWYH